MQARPTLKLRSLCQRILAHLLTLVGFDVRDTQLGTSADTCVTQDFSIRACRTTHWDCCAAVCGVLALGEGVRPLLVRRKAILTHYEKSA